MCARMQKRFHAFKQRARRYALRHFELLFYASARAQNQSQLAASCPFANWPVQALALGYFDLWRCCGIRFSLSDAKARESAVS